MEYIKHIRLDFKFDHTLVSDLIFFDGPLLSLFENKEGDLYLYYWCDTNDTLNRWIILRVSIKSIKKYLSKKISLRDLILNPIDKFLYFVDMDNDLNYNHVNLVYPSELTLSYIPDKDSFYNFANLGYNQAESKAFLLERIWTDHKDALWNLLESVAHQKIRNLYTKLVSKQSDINYDDINSIGTSKIELDSLNLDSLKIDKNFGVLSSHHIN
jgi:hypothetical protein